MEQTIASQAVVEVFDDVKVIRRLANWYGVMREAGLVFDDLQTPITDPEMRKRLVRNWQAGAPDPEVTPAQPREMPTFEPETTVAVNLAPAAQLFIPPEQQRELARKWNAERNWGFTDEDFASFGPAPACPDRTPHGRSAGNQPRYGRKNLRGSLGIGRCRPRRTQLALVGD